MSDEPLAGGRRAYDIPVDPAIKLYVETEVRDTRHQLKNEIAALGTSVVTAQLQATREHGEVHAAIQGLRTEVAQLRGDLAELIPIRDRVTQLEGHDLTDDAVAHAIDRTRTQTRNLVLGLAGLIVALAGVILTNVPG